MARAEEMTVLVVEDEPDVRFFLETVLEDAGYQVKSAADGQAAWDMIQAEPPDFISLDLVLPRKSGHRLLRDIRKDRALSKIPVLIVTAHADDDLGEGPDGIFDGVLAEGPGKYLRKPVKPIDYVRCINEALGVEERQDVESTLSAKGELERLMHGASPEALQAALDALRKG